MFTDSIEEIRCICPNICSQTPWKRSGACVLRGIPFFSDTAFINGPIRCYEWRALDDLKRIHSNDLRFYWWQLCKPCHWACHYSAISLERSSATSVSSQAHLPTTSPLHCFLWWLPFARSRPDLAALPRGEQRGSFLFTFSKKLLAPKYLSHAVSVGHLERHCVKGSITSEHSGLCGRTRESTRMERERLPARNDWFVTLVLTPWALHNVSEPPSLIFFF